MKGKMVIDIETVKGFASIYHDEIREHLLSLREIQVSTGKYSHIRESIENFMRATGLTAADMVLGNYSDDMLENDEFRISAILYTCTCILSDSKQLCMNCFRDYLSNIQHSLGHSNSNDSIKYFTEVFEFDTSIIPEYVYTSIADMMEEREANAICEKAISAINNNPEDYTSFDHYWEYMSEKAKGIINKLNTEGYLHTYDIEEFTQLMILKKLNFPAGPMYSVGRDLPIPKGIIDVLTRKLSALRQNGDIPPSGGIIDLGGSFGD